MLRPYEVELYILGNDLYCNCNAVIMLKCAAANPISQRYSECGIFTCEQKLTNSQLNMSHNSRKCFLFELTF